MLLRIRGGKVVSLGKYSWESLLHYLPPVLAGIELQPPIVSSLRIIGRLRGYAKGKPDCSVTYVIVT